MPNTREMRIEQVEDILAKWEFFYGQRAGRELWAEKPKDVQEKDIEAFNRDISFVRDFVRGVTIQKWIPVTERLPEEHDSLWAKLYGTKSWQPGLFRKCSNTVLACAESKDGSIRTVAICMYDGKWDWHKLRDDEQVTHWMPLPEPPKGE